MQDTTALPSHVPVYDSDNRPPALVDELVQLGHYRDLLIQLIARNIKTRYKRSVLGVAWTMLNPLLTMVVLWAVFSNVFVAAVEHYPAYIMSGIVLWTFFSQTTVAMTTELVWGGGLLNRIYLPRSIFALSALGTGLVNILLSLVPLAVIMLLAGTPFSPALAILPLALLLTALFALGLGLLLSTLAIQFADVVDMYQILLLAWMYLTPIIYPLSIIPEQYRWLFILNPMVHLLEVFRLPIQTGRLPDLGTLLAAVLVAAIALLGGGWFFLRHVDDIAYRV
jgi:ABC-type polysaccharide/polyol phosphate export permease